MLRNLVTIGASVLLLSAIGCGDTTGTGGGGGAGGAAAGGAAANNVDDNQTVIEQAPVVQEKMQKVQVRAVQQKH